MLGKLNPLNWFGNQDQLGDYTEIVDENIYKDLEGNIVYEYSGHSFEGMYCSTFHGKAVFDSIDEFNSRMQEIKTGENDGALVIIETPIQDENVEGEEEWE